MFEIGDIVKVILTGKLCMIIEEHVGISSFSEGKPVYIGYKRGYTVRLEDLSIKSFYDFELTHRNIEEDTDDMERPLCLQGQK